MLIKLTQSLNINEFKKFFETEEQAISERCKTFHAAKLMKAGSTCEVEPEIYEGLNEDGSYSGEYYKVKGLDLLIPTSWAEVINTSDKNAVKFLTYLPTVFTIKEARKLALFNGKNRNTPYANVHYSLKKGYVTKVGKGKYQKVI